MKWLSLVLLVFQTVSVVFVMRLSRTRHTGGPRYLNTTAVFFTEVLKLLCSLLILCHEKGSIRSASSLVWRHCRRSPVETLKVSVPALLYTLQNNLLVYQVTYQLKILTTALLSVAVLGKRLGPAKWASLVLLTAGVALILLPRDGQGAGGAAAPATAEGNATVGIVAVLCACVTSGLASVYLEKIMKNNDASIWLRNVQLAFFGAIIAFAGVLVQDGERVSEAGFLQGYSTLVWLVILLQAIGGLVVAAVLKYADNILKCFGNALSIILSGMISSVSLGEFAPDSRFVQGTLLVLAATALFGIGWPGSICHEIWTWRFSTTLAAKQYLNIGMRSEYDYQGRGEPKHAVFQHAFLDTKC
eukprot:CAMPEP_0179214556 /NCGR_PEP_ID=MMETSP0797-20121207/2380_1 /TAXON_ID=47934 /ORGANISM="Dinophysis acuminata, Strain DAEP01" /LENGTH=358 /DNA_ID=CAMNT_0020920599 /DNA_START=39 /DNA_END=1115 /DNA_ORIENTATION=-